MTWVSEKEISEATDQYVGITFLWDYLTLKK